MKTLTYEEIKTVAGSRKNCWVRCQYVADSPDVTSANYDDFYFYFKTNTQCENKSHEIESRSVTILWCAVLGWPSDGRDFS